MSEPLRQLLVLFGAEVDKKDIANVERTLGGMVKSFKGAAAAIGVTLGVGAIKSFVMEQVHLGDALARTAKQTGLGVDQLRFLQYAAERADVPAESLTMAIGKLQRAMVQAKDPNSELGKVFKTLGVATEDAEGKLRSAADVLPEIADAIKNAKSPAEQTALAMDIFGKSGAQLLPFLKEGSEGLREAQKRFRELSGGSLEEFAAQADAAGDAMTDMDLATSGLKATLALSVIPTLTRAVAGFASFVGSITKSKEAMHFLNLALVVLGLGLVGLAVKWAIGFAPAFLLGALLTAGVLSWIALFEDLWLSVTTGKGAFAELWQFVRDNFFLNFETRLAVLAETFRSVFRDVALIVSRGIESAGRFLKGDVAGALALQKENLKTIVKGGLSPVGPGLGVRALTDQAKSLGLIGPRDLMTNERGVATVPVRSEASTFSVSSGPVNISVSGAGDPEAVANLVARKVREANDTTLKATRAAVSRRPEGGS